MEIAIICADKKGKKVYGYGLGKTGDNKKCEKHKSW